MYKMSVIKNMSLKIKNKLQNKFIVSERPYIGITDTINGFRSTLASCEVVGKRQRTVSTKRQSK